MQAPLFFISVHFSFFLFSYSFLFFSSKCSLKSTMLRTIVQLQLQMTFQKMMNFNLRLKCWIFLKPRLVSLNDVLSMNSTDVYFSNVEAFLANNPWSILVIFLQHGRISKVVCNSFLQKGLLSI